MRTPQSSSLGRQPTGYAAQIPMFMLCCFHLSAVSLWDSGYQKPRALGLSAQYKLLIDYTSPLVSQLNLSYSVLTACVVCLVSQLGLSSGKVWRRGLFWFISRMYTVKTNQILFTIELSVHYLW